MRSTTGWRTTATVLRSKGDRCENKYTHGRKYGNPSQEPSAPTSNTSSVRYRLTPAGSTCTGTGGPASRNPQPEVFSWRGLQSQNNRAQKFTNYYSARKAQIKMPLFNISFLVGSPSTIVLHFFTSSSVTCLLAEPCTEVLRNTRNSSR